MADLGLRPARNADVDELARIWREGWRDGHLGHVLDELVAIRTDASFDARVTERLNALTVAQIDGVVAGFVVVAGDEVEQLYVDRARRGSGVAAMLLSAAVRQVANAGHRRAWLAVAAGNARARGFYERQGWADEGPFDYLAEGLESPIAVPCHRYVKRC